MCWRQQRPIKRFLCDAIGLHARLCVPGHSNVAEAWNLSVEMLHGVTMVGGLPISLSVAKLGFDPLKSIDCGTAERPNVSIACNSVSALRNLVAQIAQTTQ